jgi:endonuclease YncB( thermonuclease family)
MIVLMDSSLQNDENKVGGRKTNRVLLVLGIIGLICLIVLVVTLAPRITLPSFAVTPAKTTPGFYKVSEVYDGDTIAVQMDSRTEKVRMIGVDTPETHKPNSPVECGGPEASDFSKKVLTGAEVRLESDPTNQNRDRYDRLLRYIYLADGRLFNLLLITEGYGTPYTSFPFQKKQEFIAAGVKAKLENKGVWAGVCTITDQNGRFKTNPL